MAVRMKSAPAVSIPVAALTGLAALYGYAWYAARRFEYLTPETADTPGSFIEVDGVRLHYVESGAGEPVLLIHGLGASTFSFRYVIPELARSYRALALDLQGFGYSARPPEGDYSLTAHVDRAARFLDALGIDRAAVVGHSMGGAIAMRLALRHPERVSKLVLVASATDREMRRSARLAPLLTPLAPVVALCTLHRPAFRRLSLRSAVHDPAHLTPEVFEGYFRPTHIRGHLRAFAKLFADQRKDEPLTPERIVQPTLILWGEHDRWLPPTIGQELARQIPNARLELVPSAGHLVLEEQPEVCSRLLLEFLGGPVEATVEEQASATSGAEERPS